MKKQKFEKNRRTQALEEVGEEVPITKLSYDICPNLIEMQKRTYLVSKNYR